MADGGQQDNNRTIEDMACAILAACFGYGQAWDDVGCATFSRDVLGSEDDGKVPVGRDGAAITWQTETIEQAGKAIHPKSSHQPEWFLKLPRAKRDELLAWSEDPAHRMSQKRGDGIGEFEQWTGHGGHTVVIHAHDNSQAAAALAMAKLPMPLEPMLRLVALEQADQWPIVLRYCLLVGLDCRACLDAMRRILWPSPRIRKPTIDQGAKGGRADDYRRQVRAASRMMTGWLHEASVRFVTAYGGARYEPGYKSVPPIKLEPPRFEAGGLWDTNQQTYFGGKKAWAKIFCEAYRMNGTLIDPAKGVMDRGEATAIAEPLARLAA